MSKVSRKPFPFSDPNRFQDSRQYARRELERFWIHLQQILSPIEENSESTECCDDIASDLATHIADLSAHGGPYSNSVQYPLDGEITGNPFLLSYSETGLTTVPADKALVVPNGYQFTEDIVFEGNLIIV